MDVLEATIKRRSIRKFADIPVPKDIISEMLVAGQHAPIAGNFQNSRICIVDEEYLKDEIADACLHQTWIKSAPVILVIASNLHEIKTMYGTRGSDFYAVQNSATIAENMILTATANGLGSCFVSAFNSDLIKEILNMPDELDPMVVIPIGYSDEVVPVPPKIDLRAFTFFNSFDGAGKYDNIDFAFKDYAKVFQKNMSKSTKSFSNTIKRVSEVIHTSVKNKYSNWKEKKSSNVNYNSIDLPKDSDSSLDKNTLNDKKVKSVGSEKDLKKGQEVRKNINNKF